MSPSKTSKPTKAFTDEELKIMRELSADARAGKKTEGESAVLAAIAKMPEPDRSLAKKIHAIIRINAPTLMPKTWYGMPAYANKDGKVVCFFQNASKFKFRYSTLGFQDAARLDDGKMWATSYALVKLTPTDEKKIAALVKKAIR